MKIDYLHISGTQLAAQRISRQRKIEILEARQSVFKSRIRSLYDDLKAERITVDQFTDAFQEEIKSLHISSYMAGRGGQWSQVGPVEWGRMGPVLRQQFEFARRFGLDIEAGEMSDAQILARADLYAASARQSFERGMLAELGIDAGILPAHPGDGTTSCRANCKCRWSIRILSKARGDFDASWRLGSAEHCRTCRTRARLWKKLRIRGGLLQSGFEPVFAP